MVGVCVCLSVLDDGGGLHELFIFLLFLCFIFCFISLRLISSGSFDIWGKWSGGFTSGCCYVGMN